MPFVFTRQGLEVDEDTVVHVAIVVERVHQLMEKIPVCPA
jgi:hypothetical protein